MEEFDLTLWVCGGVLLSGAAWIWFRNDASKYHKAEVTFVLSVSVLWIAMVVEFYPPILFPPPSSQQPDAGRSLTDEAARGPTSRYGRLTAVYDIAAHTVYLPSGRRLEAHSGLGGMRDDPRHVNQRMRGSTPPNVYELAPLGALFFGVRALRLIPVGDAPVFGRDGFLAHTYLAGPKGDSHGCVVFRDYNSFLRAFLNGEIKRLVVVAHLD
ncbi:DUF2778 domain-containing protein [Methylocystis bryophila]|uniref:Tlde1 domain-containing protein n=1 Tax=Methylocystis bryophila TaxID=655015 RepID=A0A1W6MZG9_9HYPH|nr:hypothetical protein B1812_19665 [Methylocystis bryophila]BDV39210.1 hypothetical protein DSM21852_24630 [Methylocystis bryophila]